MAVPIDRPQVARVIVELAAGPARVVYVVHLVRNQRQWPALALITLAQVAVSLQDLVT